MRSAAEWLLALFLQFISFVVLATCYRPDVLPVVTHSKLEMKKLTVRRFISRTNTAVLELWRADCFTAGVTWTPSLPLWTQNREAQRLQSFWACKNTFYANDRLSVIRLQLSVKRCLPVWYKNKNSQCRFSAVCALTESVSHWWISE